MANNYILNDEEKEKAKMLLEAMKNNKTGNSSLGKQTVEVPKLPVYNKDLKKQTVVELPKASEIRVAKKEETKQLNGLETKWILPTAREKQKNIGTDIKGIGSNFVRSIGNLAINAYQNIGRVNSENMNKYINDAENKNNYLIAKSLERKGYNEQQIDEMLNNRATLKSIANNSTVINNVSNAVNKVVQPIEDKFEEWEQKNNFKIQENIENASNPMSKKILEVTPSIAQSSVNLIPGGSILFASGITQNYYETAKNERGMSDEEASKYASIMATLETMTEMIGAGLTKNIGKSLIKGSVKSALANFGLDIGENFLEEAVMEPLGELTTTAVAGKEKANWENIGQRSLQAGIDGAITSILMGGASAGVGSAVNVVNKINSKQTVTQVEIQNAVKDTQNSGKVDTENILKNELQNAINNKNLQQEQANNQTNTNQQQITQTENNVAQNPLSQELDVINEKHRYTNKIYEESAKKYNIDTNSETVKTVERIMTERGIQASYNADLFSNNDMESIWKTTSDGNGNVTREVIFNPNTTSEKTLQNLAVHELGHDMMGTNEFNELADMIKDYDKTREGYAEARTSLTEAYAKVYDVNSNDFNARVDEEAVMHILGNKLGDQEFINQLSIQKPSVGRKIYNWVVDKLNKLNKLTGYKSEKLFWQDVKNKFENAYKQEYFNAYDNNTVDTRYSIAGQQGMKNAIKADKSNIVIENSLKQAQQMQQNGVDNETIRKTTNWFQDRNGDWKIEISDKNMQIKKGVKLSKNKTYKFGDIIEHNDLFTLYPEFANYNVKFTDLNKAGARFVKEKNTILVNNTKLDNNKIIEGRLIHEIQHAIQVNEGFETGTTSKISKKMYYESLGEIEADNTRRRFVDEKYNNKNISSIAPETSKDNPKHSGYDNYMQNRKTIDKVKDNVVNYLQRKGDYFEEILENDVQTSDETESSNNGQIWNRLENSNKSSFSLDKNAKRYEDLSKTKYILYFRKDNGDVRVNLMDTNHNLVNQIDLWSSTDAIKQLGEKLGDNLYNYATEDEQRFEIGNDINNIGTDTDYFMSHRPTESGITADNFTNQNVETPNPKDMLEHPEYYFQMNEKYSQESINVLRKIQGNPNAEITIYRATPGNKINPGDWVSLSKSYVEYHNQSQFNGKGNILELKVKAKDVQYAGDDINEFGYFPKEDTRYSQNSSKWQSYLDKNYKNEGTGQTIQDLKLPTYSKNANKKDISYELGEGEHTKKQRKHYKSIMESPYTTDEAKAIAKELMGTDTYVPESNVKQLERADERISVGGADNELNSLMSRAMTSGNIKADDIAVGERLIQYYSKSGNREKLQDAIQATAMAGTTAGQTVQAMSLLNHQTPEGQAVWVQRSVDKMNSDLRKQRGEKAEQFNLTADMLEKIINSKNSKELQNNLEEVYKELGQQVTKNTMQKIDSWRYFAMLSSPTTHIRNMVGNFAMGGTQSIKNKIAGGIEDVVSKFNPYMERTHTLAFASEEVKAFAKEDIKNVADRLGLNQNKYNPKSRLESNMRTFKSDKLENTVGKAFEINNDLLEAEDAIGLKAGYRRALAEYMTANKLTPENITDKQLATARNYAVEQAKEATFHQDSALSSALNQLSNNNKFAKFALDATLPYRKTPINVAKAGLSYSPIGLIKSAVYDTAKLRNGNITVNQYIDNISKGLTGTGIALLGYALANAGILKASGSEDKDKAKFDEDQGKQTYSIQIGDYTYSLDWIAPSGIPLFIGVELYEIMQESKKEKSSSSDSDSLYNKFLDSSTNLLNAFANAMNPMAEMSMLSGLTSAIKSYEQGSAEVLSSLGINAVKSYVNQFVPSSLGKLAKTTDKYERSTTSTKTGALPKAIDSTKNYMMSKIPGLRQMLPTKTDIWGNDVKQSDNIVERAYRNFVAPYTRQKVSNDKINSALDYLYESTGESSVLPDDINKNLTINKQKYVLTSNEYAKYKKQYGQNSYKLLNDLVNSKEYNNLSDIQKQQAVENVYKYADEQIKIDYAKQNGLEYSESNLSASINNIVKSGGNVSESIEYLVKSKDLNNEVEKVNLLTNSNYSDKTKCAIYENFYLSDEEREKNKNISISTYVDFKGKIASETIKQRNAGDIKQDGSIKDKDKINILINSEYSPKEKQAIYEKYIKSSNDKKYNIVKQCFTDDGLNIDKYLEYKTQEFVSDKEDDGSTDGKSISGSKKKKVFDYIESIKGASYSQKLILFALEYEPEKVSDKNIIVNYVRQLPNKTDSEKLEILSNFKGVTTYKNGEFKY